MTLYWQGVWKCWAPHSSRVARGGDGGGGGDGGTSGTGGRTAVPWNPCWTVSVASSDVGQTEKNQARSSRKGPVHTCAVEVDRRAIAPTAQAKKIWWTTRLKDHARQPNDSLLFRLS